MSNSAPQGNLILPADPGRAAQARIDELTTAFRDVIQSGLFILGPHVGVFESAFSAWQMCKSAIGVANGTDALELCLRAVGVGPDDLVIVPTHTAVATAAAVYRVGAEPVLIDIDRNSFNLDLQKVEDALRKSAFRERIKAIVPVHLYGNPCNMTAITDLANRFELTVIEDCSQAHGAEWSGQRVGAFSAAAAFSCYPTKNLGAIGDAGLCVTNSEVIADRIRVLRQYGWRQRYISDEIGMNSRLDELQAALLTVQLKYLDADLDRRRKLAKNYESRLRGIPIHLPTSEPQAIHAYHQFTIQVDANMRDRLRAFLLERGVLSTVLYPLAIHRQPAYLDVAAKYKSDRSVAELVCRSLLCLPMHPMLTDDEMAIIGDAISDFDW